MRTYYSISWNWKEFIVNSKLFYSLVKDIAMNFIFVLTSEFPIESKSKANYQSISSCLSDIVMKVTTIPGTVTADISTENLP